MPQCCTRIALDEREREARHHRLHQARSGQKPDRWPVLVEVSDFTFADVMGVSVDQYLTEPLLHAEAQIRGQQWQLENLRTDAADIAVYPRLGAFPSVFGAEMTRSPGNRTWIKPWITGPQDLERLAAIDLETTGIEAINQEWRAIYRQHAEEYPVAFGDGPVFHPLAGQGPALVAASEDPLTVAADLMGADAFFMACIDDEDFIHDLLHLLTDKMIAVIQTNQAATGYSGDFFLSSDYAPMLNRDMYEEFALPTIKRIKQALAGPLRLHHCDPPQHLVDLILDEIQPEILNGFKVKQDFAGGMRAMAEAVGDRAYLEPYLDGTVMRSQSREEIYRDALTAIQLFDEHGCRFHLGAMTCDGHPFDDHDKLDAIMQASIDYAEGKRLAL